MSAQWWQWVGTVWWFWYVSAAGKYEN